MVDAKSLEVATQKVEDLQEQVNTHLEETGQVGPDLNALLDATKAKVAKEEELDPELGQSRRLQVAEANLNAAEAAVEANRRRLANGLPQGAPTPNGDLSNLLNAIKNVGEARNAGN